MSGEENPNPLGPPVCRPEGPVLLPWQMPAEPVGPVWRMIDSDARLHRRWKCVPRPEAPTLHHPGIILHNGKGPAPSGIPELLDWANASPANLMVPAARPPEGPVEGEEKAEAKSDSIWDVKFSGPKAEVKSKDGGALETYEWKKKLGSPSTFEQKTILDFPGKFDPIKDTELVIAKVEAKTRAEAAVAQGEFGSETSVFSGSGSVLKAGAGANATAHIGTKGVNLGAGASAEAHMMKGEVGTNQGALAHAKLTGGAATAEAKAKAEVILSPEQATLKGELGAEVNLIEGGVEAAVELTPRRVLTPVINAYNWVTESSVKELGEDYDWGIKINGGVTGQVGASAKAKGTIGYEKGSAKAEGSAKIGLGVGVGVKGGVEVKGVDKAWAHMKQAGVAVGNAAVNGAQWAGDKVSSGAQWAGSKVSSGAQWVGDKASSGWNRVANWWNGK